MQRTAQTYCTNCVVSLNPLLLLHTCYPQAAHQSDPALPAVEDVEDKGDGGTAEGGWKIEGLNEEDSKDAYDRRNKHKGGERFGLAEETKRVLPGLDRGGLDVL